MKDGLGDRIKEYEHKNRVFVSNKTVIDIKHYSGDPLKVPDLKTIENMIKDFKIDYSSFSIDIGVVKGKTVLVECNDCFSLGSYGLDSVKYAKLIESRWEDILI